MPKIKKTIKKPAAARRPAATKKSEPERFDFCDGIVELDGSIAKFTVKEKKFVRFYLTDANFEATKAAKLAEYDAKTDNAFRVIGCGLMKKHRIRGAINSALEVLTMPKFENLYRLGLQATGSIDACYDENGDFDIEKARQNGSIHLIQSIEVDEKVLETTSELIEKPADLNLPADERPKPEKLETSTIQRKTKIKMYSAQTALKILTDVNFAKKHELTGDGGKDLIPTATVVMYLPDNGRGDAPGAVADKAKKANQLKKTGHNAKKK